MLITRRDLLFAAGGAGVASIGFGVGGRELRATSVGNSPASKRVPVFDFIPDQLRASVRAGTNNADLTPYIQSAFASGQPLDLGAHTYRCHDRLVIDRNGVDIEGRGSIVWPGDAAIGGAIEIRNHVSDIRLAGFSMRLLANRNSRAFSAIYSVPQSASLDRYEFDGLTCEGFAMGINIAGAPTAAVAGGAGTRGTIRNCRIADTLYRDRIGSGGAHGIYMRGAAACQIVGNHIENMQGGILVEAPGLVSRNTILNAFEDNGIYAPGANRLRIVGNHIGGTRADGIAFNNSTNCEAVDNLVIDAGNACFRVQASKSIRLADNRLYSTGRTGHFVRGASSGVDAPIDILFENNVCRGYVTANPIAFAEADTLTPYRSIKVSRNMFDQVDTSALNGSFFGPYAVVNFAIRAGNADLVVEGNLLTAVRRVAGATGGASFYIRGATLERANRFSFSG